MNKKFTKLMAALALLVGLAIPMGMWGQTTVDVTLSSGTFNNNVITWTCADGNITIQQLKGNSGTAVNSSYISAPRVYKQHILSFVGTNGYTITNIDIKCDGGYYGSTKYAGTEISNNDVSNNTTALNPTWSTANGGTHTIATVSSDGLSEIYIQNGHSSDANVQLRITKLTITYKVTGSVTATTVTINTSGLTNTDVYTSTTAGSLSATVKENINNTVISGATVTWTSSDTNVATINNNGAVTLVAAGITTITASYAGGNGYGSSSATYELTVTSSEPYVQPTEIEIIPNYTFWGKIGQFSGDTYSELEGSQDNVSLNWTRGSGSTYANSTAMRFYKDNNLTFTAPTGFEITSIVITFTTTQSDLSFSPEGYTLSESTGTWTGSSATVTMSRPSNASNYAQISKFTITLAAIGNAVATTTTINMPQDFNTDIYQGTTAGTLTATVKDNDDNTISGAIVTWSSSNTGVATIDANGAVSLVAVGTTTITASYAGIDDQYRPSQATYTLEVTSSAPVVDYATLPFNWGGGTSAELTALSGVSGYSLGDYAEGNAPYRVQFNATGDYILIKTNEQPAEVSVGIKKVGGSGNSSIIIQSSSNGTDFTEVETFSNPGVQNAILTHVTTNAFAATDRYVRIYFNKPSNGSNVGVGPITIRGLETHTLTIEPYTVAQGTTDNPTNGWYLISSPVIEDITPSASNGFITNTYDLYRFNQNPTATNNEYLEWENYKIHNFNIESGKGYLYANSTGTTLIFTGTSNTNSTQTVNLGYTEGMQFAGFNLVGNPFPVSATSSMSYYVMNSTRTGIEATPVSTSTAIAPYTGVFVEATGANQTVTFTKQTQSSTSATNNNGYVNLVLSQEVNRGIANLDKAIVSFNEGDQLSKFYFGSQDANLYIAMSDKGYAIVSSEAQGEMPVSFRANENGQYILTVNPENVEMGYLHLIDNMTGADIDLLATPSYSFEAKTTDLESRFRLVFSANSNETESDSFAFFSNGQLIINNNGQATLQVIDLTGRLLSSETINGTCSTTLNAPAGVYMIRLVNGENVKVQKIVVDK